MSDMNTHLGLSSWPWRHFTDPQSLVQLVIDPKIIKWKYSSCRVGR